MRKQEKNSVRKRSGLVVCFFFLTSILLAQQPIITSFSPTSGPVGTTVVLTGTGFDTTPANNIVYFGATKATVNASIATQLTVTVPIGATYQPISVTRTTSGLTAYSGKPFNITFAGGYFDASSLAPQVSFTTGALPRSVSISDLDGDGKTDMVLTSTTNSTISILRNTATPGTISASSFAAKVDYTVGSSPYGISIADLDGDGKLDMVVANYSSNTVSVFRNTCTPGIISFSAVVNFTTGTNPSSVAIRDLDGDGKPDIAVTNFGSNTISVFGNSCTPGTISFAAKVDFTTGTGPTSVAIGDLDGDGKPDIAVADWGPDQISVLRNTSTPGSITASSFAAKVGFTTEVNPQSVSIADLDGDGKQDMAVTGGSAIISVLRNTATPGAITASSFAAKVDFAIGASSFGVSINDLDGDGRPDMAVTNYSINTVSVLINTATPGGMSASSFASKVDFTTGSSPFGLSIGDMDGDGKPEMAIADYGTILVSVLRNTITATTISSFSPSSGPVGTSVTVTGTNFDPTPSNNIVYFGAVKATVSSATSTQLIVTVPAGATYQPISVTRTSYGLTAYSSRPFIVTFTGGVIDASSFAPKVDFTTGTSPYSVSTADLDGDGKPDLGVVNQGSLTASVFRNTAALGAITAGSLASKFDFTAGSGPQSICYGDLDGDGKLDMAVANSASVTVSVFKNTATSGAINAGSFAAKVDYAVGSSPRSISIGDLDGDGRPDLAVATGGGFCVFRNTTTPGPFTASSFAPKVDFPAGSNTQSVAIGDLDGDGRPDIALSDQGSSTVYVFRNTANAGTMMANSFAPKVDFITGSSSYGVSIGDLDLDGKQDMAVANYSANTVSVFRNTATPGTITTGSFATKIDFVAAGPMNLAIGDLDGDGKPDMAAVSYTTSNVSVFKNTTTSGAITASSFATKVDYSVGLSPRSVSIGDLDADGRPDLAVANTGGTTISLLKNRAIAPQPLAQPTNLTFNNRTATSLDASFSSASGNPAGYLVLRKANSPPSDIPVDENTYTVGATIGTSIVAYVGSGTSFSESGLAAFTNYRYAVFSYNGSGIGINYLTTAPLTGQTITLAIEPTTQATGLTFSSVTETSVVVNFTNGNGASRLLVAKAGSTVDASPVDGTGYTANNTFGSGSQIGSGNYVVGDGSGPIAVFGLSPSTTYYFEVFEVNGPGSENYLLGASAGNPASTITLFPEPTLQASGIAFSNILTTSMTIDFTSGNGASRILVARSGSAVNASPVDGTTYLADTVFANGAQIGTGNFVVGIGPGPITVTGMSPGTTYYFQLFEFNTCTTKCPKSGGLENYNTNNIAGSTASQSTLGLTATLTEITAGTAPTIGGTLLEAGNANQVLAGFSVASNGSLLINRIDFGTSGFSSKLSNIRLFKSSAAGTVGTSIATNAVGNFTGLSEVITTLVYYYLVVDVLPSVNSSISSQVSLSLTESDVYFSSGGKNLVEVSRNFTFTSSQHSDVVASGGTTASIAYGNFQAASGLTTANSVSLATFTIRDGAVIVDSDNQSTTLTSLALQFSNFTNLRRVAIFDGTTNLAEQDATSFNQNFAGLSLSAADNSTKDFTIRATLKSFVTDNQYIQVSITSAIASAAGSGFASADAGGAATSATTNQMVVVATKLNFAQQPTGTLVNSVMAPAVMAEAVDANNTRDLDVVGTLGITSTGTMAGSPTATLVSGIGTYSAITHSAPATLRTMTTTNSLGLANATSTTFNILATEPSSQPSGITFPLVTQTSITVSFNAAPGSPDGYVALRRVGSASTDLPVDGNSYSLGEFRVASIVAYVGSAITFDDTGLIPGTVYHYAIYSYNGSAGTINYLTGTPPLSGSKTTESPIDNFQISAPVFDPEFAIDRKVSVDVTGARGPLTVTFNYSIITETNFAPAPANLKSGTSNTYEITLTGAMADELGLEFFFEANDGSGTIKTPNSNNYFIYKSINETSSETIPFAPGFNGKSATYQIFSVPYDLADKDILDVFNELGAYDKDKWRLFRYDANKKKYVENGDGLTKLELGKGYWFNAIGDLKEAIKPGPGPVAQKNRNDPFKINFDQGWNQVGNPYPFNIDWSVVQAANTAIGLNALKVYEPGKNYPAKTVLLPWKGAFVYADNTGTVSFPVTAKTNLSGRIDNSLLAATLDEPDWLVPITLKHGDWEQTSGIGMHSEANLSKDRFDDLTVPRFIDYIELDSYHEEFRAHYFSTDVVPSQTQFSWIFTAQSSLPESKAQLTWDRNAIATQEASLVLVDLKDQVLMDMKSEGSYEFNWSDKRQFRFLYNRNGEFSGGRSYLGRAYPNPFSESVSVPVLVEGNALETSLQVFDMMGRKIRTHTVSFDKAGLKTVVWDGRDDLGAALPAGVYLYQIVNQGKANLLNRIVKK